MNISRYEPFDLTGEAFDDLFRGFFRPVRFEGQPRQAQIRMDVREGDKSYTVQAEIPGVTKDDIHVTIEGNQVSISAEVKKDEKAGGKALCNERHFGVMSRSFTLGHDLDEGSSSAKYNNGVLELVLPKKQTAPTKKLAIQ